MLAWDYTLKIYDKIFFKALAENPIKIGQSIKKGISECKGAKIENSYLYVDRSYYESLLRSIFFSASFKKVIILSDLLYASLEDKTLLGSTLNPLYTGGLIHCFKLDKSICHFRGVGSVLSLLFYI